MVNFYFSTNVCFIIKVVLFNVSVHAAKANGTVLQKPVARDAQLLEILTTFHLMVNPMTLWVNAPTTSLKLIRS